jgi:hypothetical protein
MNKAKGILKNYCTYLKKEKKKTRDILKGKNKKLKVE